MAPSPAIVGGSFTGVTVATNEALVLPPFESVTVTVINYEPVWFAAGRMSKFRLAPKPPTTKPVAGTTADSAVEAVTVRGSAPSSSSPTTKLTLVEPSSAIETGFNPERVGG